MKTANRFNGWRMVPAVLMVGFLVLGGCASQQEKQAPQADPFVEKWRVTAEQSKGYSPAPRQKQIDLEEETAIPPRPFLGERTAERPLPQQLVSLKMHDTQVDALLRALARAADLNIIINEGITGRINVDVEHAPWDQVFLSILNAQSLGYEVEGDILRIVTLEDRNRNLQRLETEEKIRLKRRKIQMTDQLLTRVVKVDYADAGRMKSNLEQFLTEAEEGKRIGTVLVDSHTNSLIISGMRDDIERMIPIIQQLDRPTPQLRIESHILLASDDAARELGVRWGGLSKQGNFYVVNDAGQATGLVPDSTTLTGQSVSEVAASGFMVNFPTDVSSLGTGMTLGVIGQVGSNVLQMQLEALETQGKINILSSPSITTQDNQTAIIEAGDEIPFQTQQDINTFTIEFRKAVLKLEVTPHVIEGETVKLDIFVSKDQPTEDRNRETDQPTIRTRNAKTKVIVFDGQTTVIGGLIEEEKSEGESGVPGLKDVPLLGWLFKGEERSSIKQELLIFITPHILPVMEK